MNQLAPRVRTSSCLVIGCVLASVALPSCKTNSATGRSQFDALSKEEEIRIGSEAAPELTAGYGGEVPNARLTGYVTTVGQRLVAEIEEDYEDLPWEFTLLNSGVINAFALPGGKVFISRALAERFDNEAQLAGVLGHEIGHVTAEHADRAMQRQIMLAGLAVGVGVAAGDDQVTQVAAGALVTGAGVFAMTYDRGQESEADSLGMRYMTLAGYDPRGMLQVMEVLRDASGGSSQAEWLSTHPLPTTRISQIENRLTENDRYRAAVASGTHEFYESRFQSEFLVRLRQLPPPPEPPQASRGVDRFLAHPELWCAVCAARAMPDESGG